MVEPFPRRDWFLFVPLLAVVVSGCGVAEYEKRLAARVERLKEEAVFNVLYQATELRGTPILVRVPMKFTQQLVAGAEVEGKKIDPRRVTIPNLSVSGSSLVYEATVADSAGGRLPFYIYLLAIEADQAETYRTDNPRKLAADKKAAGPGAGEQPRMENGGSMIADLAGKSPSSKLVWQDVDCRTPERTSVRWQRLEVDGPQEFHYVDPGGQESFRKLPGHLEVWARYYGGHLLLVVWRVPESLRPAAEVGQLAPLVAGTVSVR